MKTLLFLFSTLLCITATSQSVWQHMNSRTDGFVPASQGRSFGSVAASPANAWASSTVLYEFGDSDISDNILVSGRMLLELATIKGIHLPIMSNVELSFEQPLREFSIGLYPWARPKDFLILHGAARFESDGQLENKRFKLFAGSELVLMSKTGLPLTASVGVASYLMSDNTQYAIEAVIVVPVANGVGLLAQVERIFGQQTIFSLGAITNKLL